MRVPPRRKSKAKRGRGETDHIGPSEESHVKKMTFLLKEMPQFIFTPKEYGLSYHANLTTSTENVNYGKLTLEEEGSSGDSLSGLAKKHHAEVFVKCPQEGASDPAIDEFLAEFENRVQINYAASRLARDCKVLITGMLGKGTLEIAGQTERPCLIYEFIKGADLEREPLPLISKDTTADDILEFALALATAVQKLHNQGVVHSFIVPRNLVRTTSDSREHIPQVSLVGFGYARLCDTKGKAGDRLAVLETDQLFRAPECRNESPHSAFWFPADIYSIGAIVYHWLARGTIETARPATDLLVLKDLSPDVRVLKRTISTNLRRAVPHIIEDNENILKILDSCLRSNAEDRFSCVEELIEAIKLARTAGRKSNESPRQSQRRLAGGDGQNLDVEVVQSWTPRDAKSERRNLPSYFYQLKRSLAESLKDDFVAISGGHYEVYGHRDKIVTSLCHLLASAQPGDSYCTMTLPDYWADDNLGSNGRFLVMNKHMVRRGVNITRLYLVSREFHELSEGEQYILDQQLEAQEDLAKFADDFDKKANDSFLSRDKEGKRVTPGTMNIFVLKVAESVIGDFEKEGSMVAFLQTNQTKLENGQQTSANSIKRIKNEDLVCLNFFSSANVSWINGKEIVKRRIHKVRYWTLDDQRRARFNKHHSRFEEYEANAMTLSHYIKQGERDDFDRFCISDLRKLVSGHRASSAKS